MKNKVISKIRLKAIDYNVSKVKYQDIFETNFLFMVEYKIWLNCHF